MLSVSTIKLLRQSPDGRPVDGTIVYGKGLNGLKLLTREGDTVRGFVYKNQEKAWAWQWSSKVFDKQDADYPIEQYPWLVSDKLQPGKDILVIQHPNGIQLHEVTSNGLVKVKQDTTFSPLLRYETKLGDFLPDDNIVSVMSRKRSDGSLLFYAVTSDSLSDPSLNPIYKYSLKDEPHSEWSSKDVKVDPVNLKQHGHQAISVRGHNATKIYEIDENDYVKLVTKLALPSDGKDRVLFGDISNSKFKDLLHLNDSGLFIYKHDDAIGEYILGSRDPSFSKSFKWDENHRKTVKMGDLDGDGRQDMVFTGPEGLKAIKIDPEEFKTEALITPGKLPAQQRSSKVLEIIGKGSMITQAQNGDMNLVELVNDNEGSSTERTTTPDTDITTTPSPVVQDKIPKESQRLGLNIKPILPWAEVWDASMLSKPINPSKGEVVMSIPIVKLESSGRTLYKVAVNYDGSQSRASVLGVGWSAGLRLDYILADDRGSALAEDTKYIFFADGRPIKMKKANSTRQNVEEYKLDELDKAKVTFHRTEERWVLEDELEEAWFGRNPNSANSDNGLRFSLGWPNWRSFGTDASKLKPFVAGWYLTKRVNKKTGYTLFYEYEKDQPDVGYGKTYTSDMRLNRVTDRDSFSISLSYQKKQSSEYEKPKFKDQRGNLLFPLIPSHYLSGLKLDAESYRQSFKFNYELTSKERVLTEIREETKTGEQPVFSMEYAMINDKRKMIGCKLSPLNQNLQVTYDKITPPGWPDYVDEQFIFQARSMPKIGYGDKYVVIGHITGSSESNRVSLRLTNRAMTKTIGESSIDFPTPEVGSKIQDFGIQAYDDSFVLMVAAADERPVFVYDKKANSPDFEAMDPIKFNFMKGSVVQFSQTVIAGTEGNSIKLYKRSDPATDQKSKWDETKLSIEKPIKALALHNEVVVGSDGSNVWLWKSDGKKWEKTKVGEAPVHDNLVDSLELDDELKDELTNVVQQKSLQFYNNLVMYSVPTIKNDATYVEANVFLLDSNYRTVRVRKSSDLIFESQKLFDIKNVIENEWHNQTLTIGYRVVNGKYKVQAIDFWTPALDDMNKNKREDFIKEQCKNINADEERDKSFKRQILFDPNRVLSLLGPEGARIGNSTLLRENGDSWKIEDVDSKPKNVLLGQEYVLVPSDEGRIYSMYKQASDSEPIFNEKLLTMHMEEANALVNRYPLYIGYQIDPKTMKLITFSEDYKIEHEFMKFNETLLTESDFKNVITVREAKADFHVEPYECVVRPITTLARPGERLFVSTSKVSADSDTRSTGFDRSYKLDVGSGEYTQIVSIIPGGDKTSRPNGWYDTVNKFKLTSSNGTVETHYYDSDGHEVYMLNRDKQNNEEEKDGDDGEDAETKSSNDDKLMDKSGQLVISELSPYKLGDEMIGYYGFESYETGIIGNSTKTWQVQGGKLVENQFSLTGSNYVRLENEKSHIDGEFKPADQRVPFIASCWVRYTGRFELDTPVPFFKAFVKTSAGEKVIGLRGRAKMRRSGWYYLELPINFDLVRRVYSSYLDYMNVPSNATLVDNEQFSIQLRVEGIDDHKIDVDHIRFSPLAHNFKATVFDYHTGLPMTYLQSNGLFPRYIKDRVGNQVGEIDSNGRLVKFSSSSLSAQFSGPGINSIPGSVEFEPQSNGSYETFDPSQLHESRWLVDNPDAWTIAPGQFLHETDDQHIITAGPGIFKPDFAATRFYYSLSDKNSQLSLLLQSDTPIKLSRRSELADIELPGGRVISSLPPVGELIVMICISDITIWLNGQLILEDSIKIKGELKPLPWSSFSFAMKGKVLLEDLVVMNHPQVKVEYMNKFGDISQTIELESTSTALISENLYDDLGRKVITTKVTRIERDSSGTLLGFRKNFITNRSQRDDNYAVRTGLVKGEVSDLNPNERDLAIDRLKFAKNPLNEVVEIGKPGKDFAVGGKFSLKRARSTEFKFLYNLFPESSGYQIETRLEPNGAEHASVLDLDGNEVAKYVRSPGFDHSLSTYEYNKDGKMTKLLPPLYHELAKTHQRLEPWIFGDKGQFTEEELELQKEYGSEYKYDKYNQIIFKKTPDTGITEYLYDSWGRMRFVVSGSSDSAKGKRIIYYNYDQDNRLLESGQLLRSLSIDELKEMVDQPNLGTSMQRQFNDWSADNPDPQKRGYIRQTSTTDDLGQVSMERKTYDSYDNLISKSAISSSNDIERISKMNNLAINGRLMQTTYPEMSDGSQVKLVYKYNLRGQLVSLGTPDKPDRFARFSYTPSGNVASEWLEPGSDHSFERRYDYNSPGYLQSIDDPMLREEVAYTHSGYGQEGYGDGIVMQTKFTAHWPDKADPKWFKVDESDIISVNGTKSCHESLRKNGYIKPNGEVTDQFNDNDFNTLSIKCANQAGQVYGKLLSERVRPQTYGHSYSYGNHQELTRAKYFSGSKVANPLQPDTFANELPGFDRQDSRAIWTNLVNGDFILNDQNRHEDLKSDIQITAIGKPGKSLLRLTNDQVPVLLNDLRGLDSNFIYYFEPISKLILHSIAVRKIFSLQEFTSIYLKWSDVYDTTPIPIVNQKRNEAHRIGTMLIAKKHLPSDPSDFISPLNEKLVEALQDYPDRIADIVGVLVSHFVTGLNESPFDEEFFKIDANGNHRLFYSGTNRMELEYYGNKLVSLKYGQTEHSVDHDSHGNVITAPHRGIARIVYDDVTDRTTSIEMVDGTKILFSYDTNGERSIKRVIDANGNLTLERFYLRDDKGNVLFDKVVNYHRVDGEVIKNQVETAYVYGPRGLLGFIRDGDFHSVMLDHSGSIRLVLRGSEVVAAYDYLPYGQLMRSYGQSDTLVYRFTGQEWDEETGLYNFHARLYDPSIGRFYQIDPKSQYFSPYKYAGNSPISFVDPDGQFVFVLAVIGLGLLFAYLGGAAANNRWNPLDWDWADGGTWTGIVGGAITGALLPFGLSGSIAAVGLPATIGLGVGVAYVSGAAANQNWNLADWRWSRPGTWNALAQGFAIGSSLPAGFKSVRGFIADLNPGKIKTGLTVGSYLSAGAFAFYGGYSVNDKNLKFWQWNFSDPNLYLTLILNFDTGFAIPVGLFKFTLKVADTIRNLGKSGEYTVNKISKLQATKEFLIDAFTDPDHWANKAATVAFFAYASASMSNRDWNILHWNWKPADGSYTYVGLFTGSLLGLGLNGMWSNKKYKIDVPSYESKPKGKDSLWNSRGIAKKLEDVHLSEFFDHFAEMIGIPKLNQAIRSASGKNWRARMVRKFLSGSWDIGIPFEQRDTIVKQSREEIEKSLNDLNKWNLENQGLSKRRFEFDPDERTDYLNCAPSNRPYGLRKRVTCPTYDESCREDNSLRTRVTRSESGASMSPTRNDFLSKHEDMIRNGEYKFIGYHGTTYDLAEKIVNSELKPSKESDEERWSGTYVADSFESALGYATQSGEEPRVLAVYANKLDVKMIAIEDGIVNNLEFNANKTSDSTTDDSFAYQLLVKSGIKLKTLVYPIESRIDVTLADTYYKLHDLVVKLSGLASDFATLADEDTSLYPSITKTHVEQLKKLGIINNNFASTLKNYLGVQDLSDEDVAKFQEIFKQDTNIYDTSRKFDSFVQAIKFKQTQGLDLNEARKVLDIPELSDSGYNAIKDHLNSKSLDEFAKDLIEIQFAFVSTERRLLTSNQIKLRDLLSSGGSVSSKDLDSILSLVHDEKSRSKNVPSFEEMMDMNSFKGKSIDEADKNTLAKLLGSSQFESHELADLMKYFAWYSASPARSVFRATDDMAAIKVVIKVRHGQRNVIEELFHVQSNSIENNVVVKIQKHFSDIDFITSVDQVKALEDLWDRNDSAASALKVSIDELLHGHEDLDDSKLQSLLGDIVNLWKQSVPIKIQAKIPREQTLRKSLNSPDIRKIVNQTVICGARIKRSIYEPVYEIANLNNSGTDADSFDDQLIDVDGSELLNKLTDQVSRVSSASISALSDLTQGFEKSGQLSQLHDLAYGLQSRNSPNSDDRNGQFGSDSQSNHKSNPRTSMSIGLVAPDVNGLLTWGILLARKWNGTEPILDERESIARQRQIEVERAIKSRQLIEQVLTRLDNKVDSNRSERLDADSGLYEAQVSKIGTLLARGVPERDIIDGLVHDLSN